jgi:hypothetical protein
MRVAVVALSVVLAGAALADAPPEAAARALARVDVAQVGDGARVTVLFGCPLRYSSHFPESPLTELRVSLVPLPGCTPTALTETAIRAPAGNAAGLSEVRLEPAGSALVMTVTFDAPVDVRLKPRPDFLGLEAAVFGRSVARRERAPAPAVTAPSSGERALPAPEVLEQQWAEARAAFDANDLATATRLLTRLIEYPEHAHRAEAQELLGLARERSGQLAHAKAEFEEYLRRYPDGPAAGRVSQRLAALTTLDSRPQVDAVGSRTSAMRWEAFGGWSQEYRYDTMSIDDGTVSFDLASQSLLVTDGDLSLRGSGERLAVQARVNAGYLYDMSQDGPGNRTRVGYAYAELSDRVFGLSGRLGRQSTQDGGVLGTFDGLNLGWRPGDDLRLGLAGGSLVESTYDALSSDRQFVSLSANWSGAVEGLEIGPYVIDQTYQGVPDRRAVGANLRWFGQGQTLVGLLDYDIDFGAVNMAMLLGTFELPGRWTLTGTIDHRKSPFLTTRNALVGQPIQSLDALIAQVGETGVRQLARDRTAEVETVSLGVSHPIGTRLQWIADLAAIRIADLPASGGVAAVPGSGTEVSLGGQLIANSLLTSGDVSIVGFRLFESDLARSVSLSLGSRFPLWGRLRAGPRLRFDHRESVSDGATQEILSPALRVDWNSGNTTIEFEAGGEWASRELPIDEEKTDRYWFSFAYRLGF